MEIIEKVTLADVRRAKPEYIYYSTGTCWWTHDPNHLSTLPGTGLPCDPRGAVLMMTDQIEGFLKAAEASPAHYGRHGLRAFIAAHHLNCIVSHLTGLPWAATTWNEYNDALDRLDKLKKG